MRINISRLMISAILTAAGIANLAFTLPAPRPADEANAKYQVRIDNFSFTPAVLTVPAGATVTWTNQDDIPHSVVSAEGSLLKSPALDTDQKFSFTFTKPGTYPYFCGIHPKMTGKVVVQ